MKNAKSLLGLAVLTLAIGFSSCAQDETMDELMDNTELSNPSNPSNDGSDKDSPTGGG